MPKKCYVLVSLTGRPRTKYDSLTGRRGYIWWLVTTCQNIVNRQTNQWLQKYNLLGRGINEEPILYLGEAMVPKSHIP